MSSLSDAFEPYFPKRPPACCPYIPTQQMSSFNNASVQMLLSVCLSLLAIQTSRDNCQTTHLFSLDSHPKDIHEYLQMHCSNWTSVWWKANGNTWFKIGYRVKSAFSDKYLDFLNHSPSTSKHLHEHYPSTLPPPYSFLRPGLRSPIGVVLARAKAYHLWLLRNRVA